MPLPRLKITYLGRNDTAADSFRDRVNGLLPARGRIHDTPRNWPRETDDGLVRMTLDVRLKDEADLRSVYTTIRDDAVLPTLGRYDVSAHLCSHEDPTVKSATDPSSGYEGASRGT